MSCLETYATLRVISKSVSPLEISRILGIEATKSEPLDPESKYKHRHIQNYWGWSSFSQASSKSSLEYVRAVLAQVRGKEQQLSE